MPDDNSQPQSPFSTEQVDSIRQLVSGIVNSAISSRDKMADKKRAEDRAAIQSDFAKLLDEKFTALKPSESTEEGKEGKGVGKNKGEDVRLATLQRQMDEMRIRAEAADKRAAESIAKERSAALKQHAGEQLSKLGIEGVRFKGAFAALQMDGRIRYRDDDSDDLVFVDDSGAEVDLTVGLSAWSKTDEAKLYLPPAGTKGAGTRPNNGPPAKLTREQAQEEAWRAAGDAIRGAFGGVDGTL